MQKNYEFQFPNRFVYDPTALEFNVQGGTTSVRQFKTARGKNVLKSLIPVTDNLLIPQSMLTRLTDGNPNNPFRASDVTSFRFQLQPSTDLQEIVVYHEIGTQPNAVVVATSLDGVTLTIWYSNDAQDTLGLGLNGTDPLFVASAKGLHVPLNCVNANYVHVFTAGFISTGPAPSSDETRIAEIEAYECVYSDNKPELITKETVRLTDLNSIQIDSSETDTSFLTWNPILNGSRYWYDGQDWVQITRPDQYNTTAEFLNNLASLFLLPTVYNLSFLVKFVSEIGDGTAVLTKLFLDFENSAIVKANTTRVYGKIIGQDGQPRTDVFVTAQLEIGGKTDATVDLDGSQSQNRIILNDSVAIQPDPLKDKVDSQGIFFKDLVPNTVLSNDKTQYNFTFWTTHPQNHKKFIPIHSMVSVIPKATKYNLAIGII